MKYSASFSEKGITDVEPATVMVSFRLAPDLRMSKVPQQISAMNKSSAIGVARLLLMLWVWSTLQMANDFPLNEKYHELGDIHRVIGQSLQIL